MRLNPPVLSTARYEEHQLAFGLQFLNAVKNIIGHESAKYSSKWLQPEEFKKLTDENEVIANVEQASRKALSLTDRPQGHKELEQEVGDQQPSTEVEAAPNGRVAVGNEIEFEVNTLRDILSRSVEQGGASFLFDSEFYLGCYGDVKEAGIEPLEHFLRYGLQEGRVPNVLFDQEFYSQLYPETTAMYPFAHFVERGMLEGRQTHPLFVPQYYHRINGDVADTNIPALQHFLMYGILEDRKFCPLFDAKFYKELYPEAAVSMGSATAHFLRFGIKENHSPNEFFSPTYYLQRYDDARLSDLPAIIHYATIGQYQHRFPGPGFDTKFYAELYPDVVTGGHPLLAHYLDWGREESRLPVASRGKAGTSHYMKAEKFLTSRYQR